MSKEQTALDAIRFEVAKEKGFISGWVELELKGSKNQLDECWKKVAIRYAKECCQANISDYKRELRKAVEQYRKIAAENKIQTGAGTLSSANFNGRIGMCEEILKLIDSIK